MIYVRLTHKHVIYIHFNKNAKDAVVIDAAHYKDILGTMNRNTY